MKVIGLDLLHAFSFVLYCGSAVMIIFFFLTYAMPCGALLGSKSKKPCGENIQSAFQPKKLNKVRFSEPNNKLILKLNLKNFNPSSAVMGIKNLKGRKIRNFLNVAFILRQ